MYFTVYEYTFQKVSKAGYMCHNYFLISGIVITGQV